MPSFYTGVTGETNRYSDIGVDAQFEHPLEKGAIIGRASYIHERQNLLASAAVGASQNSTNSLNSYKFNVSYIPNTTHSLSVGVFGTSGSSDNVLYAPSPVTGSSSASPASQGTIIEYNVNPFLNVRLGAQYIMYQKFNGASNNYDLTPNGRSAKNNNSLYVYLWLAY